MTFRQGFTPRRGPFCWMSTGLLLSFLALSGTACTWVQVTLHSSPTQQSAPPTEAASTTASPTTPATETRPRETPTAEIPPTGTPLPQRPTPTPSLHAQLDALEDHVTALRGLHPMAQIPRVITASDSIRRLLLEEVLEDPRSTEIEGVLSAFRLLGIADPEIDLSRYLDLHLESLPSWAYYQPQLGRILLPESSNLTLDQRLSYVGAYTLALLDQHFALGDAPLAQSGLPLMREDAALTLGALVFGDQALLQSQWLRIYAQAPESGANRTSFRPLCGPNDDNARETSLDPLLLACDHGLPFVRQVYLEGGWAGVDALYLDPPASTEQLLHPRPAAPHAPLTIDLTSLELPDPRWNHAARTTLGEWRLHEVLSPYVSPRGARLASEGWGGDALAVFVDEDGIPVGYLLLITWDTIYDAGEFTDFFEEYLLSRFPGLQIGEGQVRWEGGRMVSIFRRAGARTIWILAPDLPDAETMAESLGFSESSP